MTESAQGVFNLLSKKYTYDMLKSMEQKPKRFRDLERVCQNEKMRTQRLHEMEDVGIVKVKVKRIGGKAISVYGLSEKGKHTLKVAEDVKRMYKDS